MGYTPENNPYIPGDPYSYDLAWMVEEVKKAQQVGENAQASADAALQSQIEAQQAKDLSMAWAIGEDDGGPIPPGEPQYENNSKYYAEQAGASAQSASDDAADAHADMLSAKDYAENIADPVSGIVTSWLNDNITQPTTPAIDASLTVQGAAADAKATGDRFRSIMDYYPNLLSKVYPAQNYNQSVNNNVPTVHVYDSNGAEPTFDLSTGVYLLYGRGRYGSSYGGQAYSNLRLRLYKAGLGFNNAFDTEYGIAFTTAGHDVYTIGTLYNITSALTGYTVSAFIDGFGTGTRTIDYDFDSIALLQFNTLSEAKRFMLYQTGSASKGITPPNLDYGLAVLKEANLDPYSDLIFWGDSLTAGAGGGGTTFPDVCAAALGKSHKNCGVGGENCQTIAARQGGNNVVIPAGAINGTYSALYDIFGNSIAPLVQGNGALSSRYIIIEGIRCSISYSAGTYTISDYSGSPTTTPVIGKFYGSNFKSKVAVIWIGTNGGSYPGSSDNGETIKYWAQSMIGHLGHNNYIVMGLTVGEQTTPYYIAIENLLKQAFGNKYFPTRQYLIESGLAINGLTPTAQDTADIAAGKVPTSLKSDATHLNSYGYNAVGLMLANKINSLGYFD